MKKHISNNTLQDLEFPIVLQKITEFCVSDLGKEAISQTTPFQDNKLLISALNQVNEYLASFESENHIPNHEFDSISNEIYLLGIEGSFIEADKFTGTRSILFKIVIFLR